MCDSYLVVSLESQTMRGVLKSRDALYGFAKEIRTLIDVKYRLLLDLAEL